MLYYPDIKLDLDLKNNTFVDEIADIGMVRLLGHNNTD